MNIPEIINQSFLKTLLFFCESSKANLLTYGGSKQQYYLNPVNFSSLTNTQIISHEKINIISNFTLYYTQKEYEQFRYSSSKLIHIEISDDLMSLFFSKWLENVSPDYYDELFSISGKLFSLSSRLKSLIKKPQLFEQQFICKKKNIIPLITHQDLCDSLELIFSHVSNKDKQKKLLIQFANNNLSLFKRIESQTVLFSLINKHFASEEITLLKQQLKNSLKDLQDEKNYIISSFPSHFIQINKKNLFSQNYHQGLTNKRQLIFFMENLEKFLNQNDILTQCKLTKVYLMDKDATFANFSLLLHTNCNDSIIDYKELLKEFMSEGIQKINNTPQDWNKIFKSILNHYFLNKILPTNSSNIKHKINKI